MTQMDKLCLAGVAVLWLGAGLMDMAIVEADQRAVEAERQTPGVVIEYPAEQLAALEEMPLAVALEAAEPPQYPQHREDIPLSPELQVALQEACEANGVPVSLALGLIEVESHFVPDADNGVCYGLCQLNRRYYPDNLSPADNIAAGVAHLAGQLGRYRGDAPAALRAYNRGYDDGDRAYANAVLAAAERWEKIQEGGTT